MDVHHGFAVKQLRKLLDILIALFHTVAKVQKKICLAATFPVFLSSNNQNDPNTKEDEQSICIVCPLLPAACILQAGVQRRRDNCSQQQHCEKGV
jgi:hypothetical protein